MSTHTFSFFFIDAGSGMEEPPPRLLRVAEPLDGKGDVGASSSTVIWDWRTKIPWFSAHLKYSLPWTKMNLIALKQQLHLSRSGI